MVTFDDVARLALALPETAETTSWGRATWAVRQLPDPNRARARVSANPPKLKGFVWERPLSKKDRKDLVDAGVEAPPDEVILGVRTDGLADKEAALAEFPDAVFVTPHFNGYPAVLVRLDRIAEAQLKELVTGAWLAVAPPWMATRLDPTD